MYKYHFEKSNMELLKAHLSALLGICKLHIQISSVHMCVVPRPDSQDAVFKRVYASPGLPCIVEHIIQPFGSIILNISVNQ